MNLTKAERFRLGVFVTVGVVLLGTAVVVLAGLLLVEVRAEYYVSFGESVSGLEPSAQVKYQGLRVGRVDSLKIDPDNPQNIRVTLTLDPDAVLHEGTHALLDMSGLTGIKTINLTPGDPERPIIPPGSQIPVQESLVGKIADRAEAISEKVDRVATNLARITSAANVQRFEEMIDNTTRLLVDVDTLDNETREPLAVALSEFGKYGKSIRNVSDEAAVTMRDLRSEVKTTLAAGRTTLDEVRRLLKAVDAKQVNQTVTAASNVMTTLDQKLNAEELGETLAALQLALANVVKLMQELDLTVRASREDLVLSLKHVRQATQDLREFSRIIAQDPSVLLRGKGSQE
ncbi:MAG: MlaD family protein [Deltaproteobacteria bacterium]